MPTGCHAPSTLRPRFSSAAFRSRLPAAKSGFRRLRGLWRDANGSVVEGFQGIEDDGQELPDPFPRDKGYDSCAQIVI